jgi:hypothetical protein
MGKHAGDFGHFCLAAEKGRGLEGEIVPRSVPGAVDTLVQPGRLGGRLDA